MNWPSSWLLISLVFAALCSCGGSRPSAAAGHEPGQGARTKERKDPDANDPEETWPTSPVQERPTSDLPTGTLVLHVGDSFAAALGIPLAKRFKAAGLRSALEFKTASYIPNWAASDDLRKFLGRYNPDLVLVTLGANELEIPDPPRRARAIERIVATIGGRPCVWISPPLWKPDTGLLAVIREHVAPCRYLDSDQLVRDLPRGRDRIHPSKEGREIWADAVVIWLSRARDPRGESPWSLRTDWPR